jgi:hypothetical protein
MEPRQDESDTRNLTPQRTTKQKRRFQIVKLEERIAPNKGGVPGNGHSQAVHCNPYR